MREQMARAIFLVTHKPEDWDSPLFMCNRDTAIREADAALDAMMEPSMQLTDAAGVNPFNPTAGETCTRFWQGMILAIKEGK